MKIKYVNEFVQKLEMCDSTACVYQLIYDENESDDTKIIQQFIMHGLGLLIKGYSYLSHMFYACSFSYNAAVQIHINKDTHFLSLNTNNTLFSWGVGNYNKNIT